MMIAWVGLSNKPWCEPLDHTTIIVVRSNHPNYKYALVDDKYNFIGNLTKISEASSYYKREVKEGVIQIKRNLSFTLDMVSQMERTKSISRKATRLKGISRN